MKVRLNKPIGNNPKDAVVDVPDARAVYWIKIGVARHYRPASKVEEKPVEVEEPKREKAVKKSASKEKVQINKPPSKKRIKKPGS